MILGQCDFKLVLIFLVLTFNGFLPLLADDHELEEDGQLEESAVSDFGHAGHLSRKPFRGYGRYRQEFKLLCEGLAQDGRKEKLYEILLPISAKDPQCVACRPLLSGFVTNCKPKELEKDLKKKQSKGEENALTPNPEATTTPVVEEEGKELEETNKISLQREPNIVVLDIVSSVFEEIAGDEGIYLESVKAVKKLALALRDPNHKTQGERDYFDTLASYIEAPFIQWLEEKKEKEEIILKEQKQEVLEELF